MKNLPECLRSIVVGRPSALGEESPFKRRFFRDVASVSILMLAGLVVGLGINRLTKAPLPLVYQSPEERFSASLATLISTPPLNLLPPTRIQLEQFRSAVQDRAAIILDARPSVFFKDGHVPGALNLARDNFTRDFQRLVPILKLAEEKPIIVYCSGGDCHDSRLVANALLVLGFSNVSVFTGGWDAWSAAKLPVSMGGAT